MSNSTAHIPPARAGRRTLSPETQPTERQAALVDYLRRFSAERGYSPTIREIGAHFGWTSTNAVAAYLRTLRRIGVVTWEERKSRTLRVVGGAR